MSDYAKEMKEALDEAKAFNRRVMENQLFGVPLSEEDMKWLFDRIDNDDE